MDLGNEQQMNENLSAAGGGRGGPQNQSNNDGNNGGGNPPSFRSAQDYKMPETKSFFDNVGDGARTIYDIYKQFSPLGFVGRGIGSLFDKLGDLRGFNVDGSRRTQEEYEEARQNRITQNRIADIMGRDAPFTQMTLDNLESLYGKGNVPSNINDSLIGTTNITRSGNTNQGYLNDGILSVAPKSAMNNVMLADAQLSFPFDNMNTGDPYKDNLYDQDGNYKPSLDKNNLFADVSQADLMLNNMRGSKQYNLNDFRGFSENPTLTQQELDGIRNRTITKPTGKFRV